MPLARDQLVRQAAPTARAFVAVFLARQPGGAIRAPGARAGAPARAARLVVLPACPCPSGILPAAVWCSGSPTSGSWSAAALAAAAASPCWSSARRSAPCGLAARGSPVSSPAWSPAVACRLLARRFGHPRRRWPPPLPLACAVLIAQVEQPAAARWVAAFCARLSCGRLPAAARGAPRVAARRPGCRAPVRLRRSRFPAMARHLAATRPDDGVQPVL